jgi:hypothetical protein
MPEALAWIIPLVSAGVGGTEMGLNIAGVGQPSPGDAAKKQQAMLDKQKQDEAKQLALQKQEMFKHFAPDVQSATGGALTDQAFSQMVATLSGSPGDIGLAQQTIFGNSDTGLSTGTAGG